MDEELLQEPAEQGDLPQESPSQGALPEERRALDAAGKVALSAMLATSLVAVLSEPPRTELITLPEPTPIVQQYSPYVDDVEPAEDDEDDHDTSRWRRLLKLLRYLMIALLFAATLVFGALKGCASCTAVALLPNAEQEQDSNQE